MKVTSEEIPQADNLIDVVKTVIAVSQGAITFQQIAQAIGKVERQGRYYRKAAEIVGLVINKNNQAYLTPAGHAFMLNNPTLTNPALLQGVLSARIFQRIIPFLESKGLEGASRTQFEYFLNETADLGDNSMANRRISTIISWLIALDIIHQIDNSKYILSKTSINQRLDNILFDNLDEPLLPNSNNLSEYNIVQQRSSSAIEAIVTYRDSALLERADNAHRRLVNLTSDRIRNAGSLPKYNQLIDLATHYDGNDFIFEMKSTTDTNEKSQIRAGLSQLYEYRFLQNKPLAKLILVIENPLSIKELWRQNYLEQDRDVYLIWDGSDELHGNHKTREDLHFLNLQS